MKAMLLSVSLFLMAGAAGAEDTRHTDVLTTDALIWKDNTAFPNVIPSAVMVADPRKKQWHALPVLHGGRGGRPPLAGARVGGRGSETRKPHVVVTASDQIRTNVHYFGHFLLRRHSRRSDRRARRGLRP